MSAQTAAVDDSTVKASNGEAVPTRRLLHLALQFLSYEALRDISGHFSEQPLGRIRWVITLPPSLGSGARHWIRQVAYEVSDKRWAPLLSILLFCRPSFFSLLNFVLFSCIIFSCALFCVIMIASSCWFYIYFWLIYALMCAKFPNSNVNISPDSKQGLS